MKKNIRSIATTTCILLLAGWTFSQNDSRLLVQVTNIKASQGQLIIAVFDTDQTFLKESIIDSPVYPVHSLKDLAISIPDLPYGTYALSVYHDKNSNGELDTNLLGIPKEPYGFSNNASGAIGPPTYSQAAFSYHTNGQTIKISLK